MFFLYSIVYTLAFIVLLPRFIFDALFNGKYAAGFKQRLGFLPTFDSHGKESRLASLCFRRRNKRRTAAGNKDKGKFS